MNIFYWILSIIGGVILLTVVLFIFLWVRSIRTTLRRDEELDALVRPVLDLLEQEKVPDNELILNLAMNPLIRAHCLSRLTDSGHEGIFPSKYKTTEMIAESDLTRWLYHGNELGSIPDELELVFEQQVSEDNRKGRCFLFKFRVHEPHWAASNGWMCGVAGPFWDGDELQFGAESTFSELSSYNGQSNEQHLDYLATASKRFGWVMPTITTG